MPRFNLLQNKRINYALFSKSVWICNEPHTPCFSRKYIKQYLFKNSISVILFFFVVEHVEFKNVKSNWVLIQYIPKKVSWKNIVIYNQIWN